MNTVIRQVRPDLARKCAVALGRPLEEIWPDDDIQVMHYDLFPHEIIHIENAGGQIDQVLDQRVTVGCFPWRFMGAKQRSAGLWPSCSRWLLALKPLALSWRTHVEMDTVIGSVLLLFQEKNFRARHGRRGGHLLMANR